MSVHARVMMVPICRKQHDDANFVKRYFLANIVVLVSILLASICLANNVAVAHFYRPKSRLLYLQTNQDRTLNCSLTLYYKAKPFSKHSKLLGRLLYNVIHRLFQQWVSFFSMSHKEKTLKFWKENFVEKTKMHPFIILEDEFTKLVISFTRFCDNWHLFLFDHNLV